MHRVYLVLATCATGLPWLGSAAAMQESDDPRSTQSVCFPIASRDAFEALLQQCLPSSHDGIISIAQDTGSQTLHDSLDQNISSDSQALGLDHPLPSIVSTDIETDIDPLSDNPDFLSFEQWKAQMLEKAGQSPEHVKGTREGVPKPDNRQRPGNFNSALDTIGDDAEIEFGGTNFAGGDGAVSAPAQQPERAEAPVQEGQEPEQKKKLRKEAGTTSKERFNYASFDCAATVLKTNPECKGASSVLVENKDTYMLNTCSSKNKFLIVELCNDILIDTVVLSNFEFFSSTFQKFRVSISDRYPVKIDKWRELGTFDAQNTRAIQPFMIENGLMWARYLRIEFLTHYGSEYYCPISLLRVHGKTMMDDYLYEVKSSRGEDDGDEDEDTSAESTSFSSQAVPTSTIQSEDSQASSAAVSANTTIFFLEHKGHYSCISYASPLIEQSHLLRHSCDVSVPPPNSLSHSNKSSTKSPQLKSDVKRSTTFTKRENPTNVKSSEPQKTIEVVISSPNPLTGSSKPAASSSQASSPSVTTTSTESSKPPTKLPASAAQSSTKSSSRSPSAASSNSTTLSSTSTAPRTPMSPSPPAPSPSTQDSFFKSVHKRLTHLESNATLSMQYIEEQSRLLRDALARTERRQRARINAVFERWNRTVRAELRDALRAQADELQRDMATLRRQNAEELKAMKAEAAAEVKIMRLWITGLGLALTALSIGFVWYIQRAIAKRAGGVAKAVAGNGVAIRPTSSHGRPRSVAHVRIDSDDLLSRPSTPQSRSRPPSRYGRWTPLRGLAAGLPRPPSQGTPGRDTPDSAARHTSKEDHSDENGLLTPTPSDNEGDGGRTLSPGREAVLRRTWSTPAFGDLRDDLGLEDGGGAPLSDALQKR